MKTKEKINSKEQDKYMKNIESLLDEADFCSEIDNKRLTHKEVFECFK